MAAGFIQLRRRGRRIASAILSLLDIRRSDASATRD
jgi:hypothetical protein